ncbi:MAG: tRNA (adenosine(37)-N6)-threonylcarbamoyltransferase complex ATPase subunit type 1 TsaE [Muribaculaceae bacterium]|nr:tRNA (adenosine(37)-N6)-threonylcarbamoyltransferase complex ATPase subunit type 1 TsaE [Muribaculaceae bacterium]MDE6093792.1 tRNA (adenosine(37)-N6)-threonylcarbamoyltransferase complex ATPase subunit type 1 TsaE [Muribaculaceae bacterium]
MTETKFNIAAASQNDIDSAADRILEAADGCSVIAFHGEMGAGKTTIISAIARALGVSPEEVSSPSFSIVNEYRSEATAELIYHFDLYRLQDIEQAVEIGIEDYFDSGALCLIEWPDLIDPLLPVATTDVFISVLPDNTREIRIANPL